jgi:hypothetical protein
MQICRHGWLELVGSKSPQDRSSEVRPKAPTRALYDTLLAQISVSQSAERFSIRLSKGLGPVLRFLSAQGLRLAVKPLPRLRKAAFS